MFRVSSNYSRYLKLIMYIYKEKSKERETQNLKYEKKFLR